MSAANAAIYYHPGGFDTGGKRLMGRQAAGEAFLKGFARHGGVDRLYCYAPDRADFADFESRVAALAREHPGCAWVEPHDGGQLSRIGCLYRGDPNLSDLAWRRRGVANRAYSLCGITHTTASARVMDALGDLAIAPVQPWDAIICTSRAVKGMVEHIWQSWSGYLEERIGRRPEIPVQLPIIPLGVDSDAFAPSARAEQARAELRQRLGIADGDVAVLFFGRLSYHAKAHPLPMYLGLQAAAESAAARVHLILAGWFANDAIRDEFISAAQAYCPAVKVAIVDGRDATIRAGIWFAADIFTSLSDNVQETFGLAPIEAMAAALPLVVSDWDGYRDTVRHGVDGFCAPTHMPPPGLGGDLAWRHYTGIDSYDRYIGHVSQTTSVDIAACKEAYIALIGQPELRRRMGEAGRRRAREVFDWRVVIAAYQALWQDLAERRRGGREYAPLSPGAPAHPLREDPYAVFADYPTAAFDVADEVELVAGAEAGQLTRLRGQGMNTFAAAVLGDAADCEALLDRLETLRRCTVEQLLAGFPPDKRRVLHRTVGWLAKVGLVRFVGRSE